MQPLLLGVQPGGALFDGLLHDADVSGTVLRGLACGERSGVHHAASARCRRACPPAVRAHPSPCFHHPSPLLPCLTRERSHGLLRLLQQAGLVLAAGKPDGQAVQGAHAHGIVRGKLVLQELDKVLQGACALVPGVLEWEWQTKVTQRQGAAPGRPQRSGAGSRQGLHGSTDFSLDLLLVKAPPAPGPPKRNLRRAHRHIPVCSLLGGGDGLASTKVVDGGVAAHAKPGRQLAVRVGVHLGNEDAAAQRRVGLHLVSQLVPDGLQALAVPAPALGGGGLGVGPGW